MTFAGHNELLLGYTVDGALLGIGGICPETLQGGLSRGSIGGVETLSSLVHIFRTGS
jgi:hypothetical protein